MNGENLTNFRQTNYDPLIRPVRGMDGRWTVDAWGTLGGRNLNRVGRVASLLNDRAERAVTVDRHDFIPHKRIPQR